MGPTAESSSATGAPGSAEDPVVPVQLSYRAPKEDAVGARRRFSQLLRASVAVCLGLILVLFTFGIAMAVWGEMREPGERFSAIVCGVLAMIGIGAAAWCAGDYFTGKNP